MKPVLRIVSYCSGGADALTDQGAHVLSWQITLDEDAVPSVVLQAILPGSQIERSKPPHKTMEEIL